MRERARRAAIALGCAASLSGAALAAADLGAAEPPHRHAQAVVLDGSRRGASQPAGSGEGMPTPGGGPGPLGWIPLALVGGGGLSAGLTLRRSRSGRAEAAAERVEAFARLAHDLRAPLTVIRGQCHSLRRGQPRLRHPARLDIIEAEAVRLAGAIDGLMELARPCRRAVAEPRGAVALAAVLTELDERHRGAAEAEGVRILTALPGEPISVAADAEALRRLLDNLLQNAMRHCPAGGSVRLSATSDGGLGVIRVSDDGPGIDPRDEAAIFLAGRRGREASGAGWGLGLAIAREIAEAQRGRLDLERSGPGATFRLSLPLCRERRRRRVPAAG
ncbi:MAG: two-component system, OmpR family, sensor histidine kinase KdpD [Miltoncostaeaceae bacterium]|nr:two-component system, OmpR family, sensor histidine kinase KdpD [Miltoncostaeaceae bacterium]